MVAEEVTEEEPTGRKMASIQVIEALDPIEGADKIEVATILGWQCVVQKVMNYNVGQKIVFCEVDSKFPEDDPEFEFMRAHKFRLKTVRLKGQISQGLVFSVAILNGFVADRGVGDDVSDILGITKYEPPLPKEMQGVCRSTFPSFIPKTDEERIQTCKYVLDAYRGMLFQATEKVDGTSCTMFVKNGEFHVCSRNMDLLESEGNIYWGIARQINAEELLRESVGDIAVQGEIIGEGVQGNHLNIKGKRFLVFNVYDWRTGEHLTPDKLQYFCEHHRFDQVPIVIDNYQLPRAVDELVERVTRKSIINPKVWAEGMVFRPYTEMRDHNLGRVSFKVVNPSYLLKYEA
jgi:RNA ligase (TIGR02306 family)